MEKIQMEYNALDAKLALVEGRDCDRDDYLIAAFCGIIAGLIDSIFVGKPNVKNATNNSVLGNEVDKLSEKLVEKFAKASLKTDIKTYERVVSKLSGKSLSRKEYAALLNEELLNAGIPSNFSAEPDKRKLVSMLMNNQIDKNFRINPKYDGFKGNNSLLTYLENKYKVCYDQSTISKIKEDASLVLSPDNHHLKSIAHWPDVIGLVFSIMDQFSGKTTFISDGRIITLTPNHSIPQLRGKSFIEKIFYGFVNWFGHLMSDLCGSHSSKGRGSGIPIPFFGIFVGCDFGNISITESDEADGLSLSQLAIKVFENGYDARFGITLSIPVLIQDLMIRFLWSLKSRFVLKKSWVNSIPTGRHKDLRMMLLVGNAALCLVDGTDALLRSGGNILEFVLHLNIIAWMKLVQSSLKEICIKYGFTYADLKVQYEFIEFQLEAIIVDLKKIDYNKYELMIAGLDDIYSYFVFEDIDNAICGLEMIIGQKKGIAEVGGLDGFSQKLLDDEFCFTIGG